MSGPSLVPDGYAFLFFSGLADTNLQNCIKGANHKGLRTGAFRAVLLCEYVTLPPGGRRRTVALLSHDDGGLRAFPRHHMTGDATAGSVIACYSLLVNG